MNDPNDSNQGQESFDPGQSDQGPSYPDKSDRFKIPDGEAVPANPAADSMVDSSPADEEEVEKVQDLLANVKKNKREEEELDMTPMIDVTFLLLVFFVVTASFKVQMAIQQPPTDEPSMKFIEDDDNEDYIEVYIDRYNSYWVSTRDEEGEAAESDPAMRSFVFDRANLNDISRMVILAHNDSLHKKVVTAYDAAINAKIAMVNIKYTEDDKY